MVFKINLSTKEGKTFKLELDGEGLVGKELHDKFSGKELSNDLEGYEFEITGASDKAGFTSMKDVEGTGLRKVLLTYGKAMKKRPKKEGKRKRSKNKPKGLRLRKTVRGKVISPEIVQINLKILKQGAKELSKVFPDQNKGKEVKTLTEETKPVEEKPQEKKEEVKQESKPEEKKKEEPKVDKEDLKST
jgi:small subunit ribosomal protein S6e